MTVIMTDSSSDFTMEEAKAEGVVVLPMRITFGTEEYIDKVTIDDAEFYRKLTTEKVLPSTSLLNPHDFSEAFAQYPDDDIIVITIASGISGTFQSAMLAKELVERDRIFVIDSKSTTCGQHLLVDEAVDLRKQGMNADSIAERLESMANRLRIIGGVDTLEYLVRGGRLNAVSGVIGTALNLKPLITVYDGVITTIAKCRGNKNALKEMYRFANEVYGVDESYRVVYGHTFDEERMHQLMERMPYKGDYHIIGSVVGTHVGTGAVAIAFIEKEK